MVTAKEKLSLANDISNIIPLDAETCSQMIDFASTLPKSEVSDHFLNFLGESEATTEFLTKFIDIIDSSKAPKKQKPPVPVVPVVPTPSTSKAKNASPWETGRPSVSNSPSPVPKPSKTSTKLVSDLVTTKPTTTKKDNRKARKKHTDNLKDIESILSELEVTEAREARTTCFCNGTRHPLFEIAPNCLNCGKIICAREGLQPCSFCHHELLSVKDRREIRDILSKERNELEGKQPIPKTSSPEPTKSSKPKKIVVSMRQGENFWKAQEAALKQADEEQRLHRQIQEDEERRKEEEEQQAAEMKYYEEAKDVDNDLLAAQERLSTLLSFQDNGVERTKIIDNAADYELATSNSGNMWLSATERALKLKKQHRQLRKYEEGEQRRTGRGKRFVEMVIRDGKAVMVERFSNEDEGNAEGEDIRTLEDEVKENKKLTEETMAQNIWDYEADQSKWEKPIYVGGGKEVEYDTPILKKRVQFDTADQNDLIVKSY